MEVYLPVQVESRIAYVYLRLCFKKAMEQIVRGAIG